MKTFIDEKEEILRRAATHILRTLADKSDAVLALGGGRDELALYRELASRCRSGGLTFPRARVLALAEFCGAQEEKTVLFSLREALRDCGIPEENFHAPREDDPETYEALITSMGGIDLAVTGIGLNAAVGFNEPATPYSSLTHRQKLTERTRKRFSSRFGGLEEVPERGVTMGIRTVCSARDILVIALEKEISAAVFQMLYARDDSVFPAAFLQLPREVSVYLDREAAERL